MRERGLRIPEDIAVVCFDDIEHASRFHPFLTVMAMISISLGLMNLIPIPVLDGFHILSAAIEGVRRRPLSLRFREIANVVGVLLVLGLMLFALKNDAVRKFFD